MCAGTKDVGKLGFTVLLVILFADMVSATERNTTPDFSKLDDCPNPDGLYITVTSHFNIPKAKLACARKVKVKIEGAKYEFDALVSVAADKKAPLVVILNGAGGKKDGKLTLLWGSWLEQKGYSIFTFDSTFSPAMTAKLQLGVAGNIIFEAEVASKIISQLISTQLGKNPEKIGIVGMSYGATQALNMLKLSNEGRLSFHIDAVQAYSPLISMRETAKLLDEGFTWDWKATELYSTFYNLKQEWPMKKSYDPNMMRAAISRVFFMDLAELALLNDSLFADELDCHCLGRLIPTREMTGSHAKLSEQERKDYSESPNIVNYSSYYHKLVVPYWKLHGYQGDLFAPGELSNLAGDGSPRAKVVLAANDPLNLSKAAEEIQKKIPTIIVLPRGGHLGYGKSEWTKDSLENIFK